MSWQPLADSAPNVSAAAATAAQAAEAAEIEPAVPSRAPDVEAAKAVGPAVTVDDPRKYAPSQVNETQAPSLLSVRALRGTAGADFEGMAAVLRGAPKKNILKKVLPFIYDERDFVAYGEVVRFILIKGDCCFVFGEETDASPLYSIPLDELTPILEDPKKPDKASVTISPTANSNMSKEDLKTVLLKYRDGKQAYQFTFNAHNDKSVAKRFVDAVERASRQGSSLNADVRGSVMHAEAVGKEGAKKQPHI